MSGQLKERYVTEVVPALEKQFGYDNPMRVPRLDKIVLNIGLGEALDERQGGRRGRRRPAADHGPEADRHPRQAVDRAVPRPDRQCRSA